MEISPVTERPLPYQAALPTRPLADIDLLVIHCTELPDLQTAREYGERLLYAESGTGNSGHFYIDRDGTTEQWLNPKCIAHHVRGFNTRSIGIELVNTGRYPDWFHSAHQLMTERYPGPQIEALLGLIAALRSTLPGLLWIAGHADLDLERVAADNDATIQIRRKLDPGPLFPWPQVLAESGLVPYTPPHAPRHIPSSTSP